MKPRTLCFCQPVAAMISGRVAPAGRPTSARTCWVFVGGTAGRRAGEWTAGGSGGEIWSGGCWLTRKRQIRRMAVRRLVNRETDCTLGSLFQISTSRRLDQFAASGTSWRSSEKRKWEPALRLAAGVIVFFGVTSNVVIERASRRRPGAGRSSSHSSRRRSQGECCMKRENFFEARGTNRSIAASPTRLFAWAYKAAPRGPCVTGCWVEARDLRLEIEGDPPNRRNPRLSSTMAPTGQSRRKARRMA